MNAVRYFVCLQFIAYLLFLAWEPMPLVATVSHGPEFRSVPCSDNYDLRASSKISRPIREDKQRIENKQGKEINVLI